MERYLAVPLAAGQEMRPLFRFKRRTADVPTEKPDPMAMPEKLEIDYYFSCQPIKNAIYNIVHQSLKKITIGIILYFLPVMEKGGVEQFEGYSSQGLR